MRHDFLDRLPRSLARLSIRPSLRQTAKRSHVSMLEQVDPLDSGEFKDKDRMLKGKVWSMVFKYHRHRIRRRLAMRRDGGGKLQHVVCDARSRAVTAIVAG